MSISLRRMVPTLLPEYPDLQPIALESPAYTWTKARGYAKGMTSSEEDGYAGERLQFAPQMLLHEA